MTRHSLTGLLHFRHCKPWIGRSRRVYQVLLLSLMALAIDPGAGRADPIFAQCVGDDVSGKVTLIIDPANRTVIMDNVKYLYNETLRYAQWRQDDRNHKGFYVIWTMDRSNLVLDRKAYDNHDKSFDQDDYQCQFARPQF